MTLNFQTMSSHSEKYKLLIWKKIRNCLVAKSWIYYMSSVIYFITRTISWISFSWATSKQLQYVGLSGHNHKKISLGLIIIIIFLFFKHIAEFSKARKAFSEYDDTGVYWNLLELFMNVERWGVHPAHWFRRNSDQRSKIEPRSAARNF